MKEIKPYLLNEVRSEREGIMNRKQSFVLYKIIKKKDGHMFINPNSINLIVLIQCFQKQVLQLVKQVQLYEYYISIHIQLSKISSLREDPEVTLDSILMKEHKATKQLLEAEQILQQILQRDQRLTSAWALWGYVLELLGQNEKAGEVILTSLEWNKINSFTDYSVCSILI